MYFPLILNRLINFFILGQGLKAEYLKIITDTAAQIHLNNGGSQKSRDRLLAQIRNYESKQRPYHGKFDSNLETPMSW